MAVKNQTGQKMLPGTRPAPQVCRQIKLQCQACGYVLRTTRRWLAAGKPVCVCQRRSNKAWQAIGESTFAVEGGESNVQ